MRRDSELYKKCYTVCEYTEKYIYWVALNNNM